MLNTQIRNHYSVSGLCVVWAGIEVRDYIAMFEGTKDKCEMFLEDREGIERKLKEYWSKEDRISQQGKELRLKYPKKFISWDGGSEEFILENKNGTVWKRIKLM